MKQFWAGFGLATLFCVGGTVWLLSKTGNEPIMFPMKVAHGAQDYYHFEGSIYGEGKDAPVNNLINTWCFKGRMECEVTTQNEVGSNHVGSLHDDTIKVRKWDDREIIADSEGKNPAQCKWYEIKVDLKTDEITYTSIPNKNPIAELCRQFTPQVYRWRIDNGKAWSINADGSERPNR